PLPKAKVCNPDARGPNLEAKQRAAFADYVHLLVDLDDPQTAFDRYVPGQYINHNPFAEQGREFSIPFLIDALKSQGVQTIRKRFFFGEGYGFTHIKVIQGNATFSVMDYFRFQGTCIVEHWDVVQEVTGNEPNPIAYF
ncbi:hypothetical protein FA15DRAFT_565058, partial [Coprinopsis marcescibilis]